jgi:carbon-monoxide dehydrogenase medium subunit
MAGTALFYDLDADGKARNAHVGAIGVGDRPARLAAAEAAINGHAVNLATSERAGAAASEAVTPQSDIHASAAYRKSLLGTLVERALQSACA